MSRLAYPFGLEPVWLEISCQRDPFFNYARLFAWSSLASQLQDALKRASEEALFPDGQQLTIPADAVPLVLTDTSQQPMLNESALGRSTCMGFD